MYIAATSSGTSAAFIVIVTFSSCTYLCKICENHLGYAVHMTERMQILLHLLLKFVFTVLNSTSQQRCLNSISQNRFLNSVSASVHEQLLHKMKEKALCFIGNVLASRLPPQMLYNLLTLFLSVF